MDELPQICLQRGLQRDIDVAGADSSPRVLQLVCTLSPLDCVTRNMHTWTDSPQTLNHTPARIVHTTTTSPNRYHT